MAARIAVNAGAVCNRIIAGGDICARKSAVTAVETAVQHRNGYTAAVGDVQRIIYAQLGKFPTGKSIPASRTIRTNRRLRLTGADGITSPSDAVDLAVVRTVRETSFSIYSSLSAFSREKASASFRYSRKRRFSLPDRSVYENGSTISYTSESGAVGEKRTI